MINLILYLTNVKDSQPQDLLKNVTSFHGVLGEGTRGGHEVIPAAPVARIWVAIRSKRKINHQYLLGKPQLALLCSQLKKLILYGNKF